MFLCMLDSDVKPPKKTLHVSLVLPQLTPTKTHWKMQNQKLLVDSKRENKTTKLPKRSSIAIHLMAFLVTGVSLGGNA